MFIFLIISITEMYWSNDFTESSIINLIEDKIKKIK